MIGETGSAFNPSSTYDKYMQKLSINTETEYDELLTDIKQLEGSRNKSETDTVLQQIMNSLKINYETSHAQELNSRNLKIRTGEESDESPPLSPLTPTVGPIAPTTPVSPVNHEEAFEEEQEIEEEVPEGSRAPLTSPTGAEGQPQSPPAGEGNLIERGRLQREEDSKRGPQGDKTGEGRIAPQNSPTGQ